jgi:triacylglycerol lipase
MKKPDSKHLVDPQLLPILEVFPDSVLTEETLPAARAMEFPFVSDPVASEAVAMVTRQVPGPQGAPDVGLVIYTPKAASAARPCIFHMHGGGYVAGTAASHEPLHRSLALAADCVIASVDYRLAPETRFPGAIEDCYAALSWVYAQASALGIDSTRIGVMGESAGGGLAASLALLARDRGVHRLAFQHLVYPMIDDRTCARRDHHPFAGEFVWTAQKNNFGWSALLGVPPGTPGVSPYAAAARATDLAGLPPTFIATAALDLFIDEDLDYAQRLMRCGVPVELHVYPGAFHAFDLFPDSVVARNAGRDSLAALRRFLHPG